MDGQYIPTEIKESSNYISLLIYRDRPVLATLGIRWDPLTWKGLAYANPFDDHLNGYHCHLPIPGR